MNRLLPLVAATGFLAMSAGFAEAGQWNRSGSFTGPRGNTATMSGGGSCSGGSCSYGRTVTGPQGNSYSRQGYATRTAPGQFQSGATYTGPRGGTATRSGSLSVTR